MPLNRPFRRTARHFTDLSYQIGGKGRYIRCSHFAEDGRRYIRAALMLQADMLRVFEFVEPAQSNFNCYSFRIHELLTRACIEIEANFKAILRENGYKRPGDWNISDYRKVEATHFLSEYEVKTPDFLDPSYTFQPYLNWTESGKPVWHRAYNSTKHDRHEHFSQATLENLLGAMSALFALLASQFHTEDLSGNPDLLFIGGGPDDGFEPVAGGLFRVKFPRLARGDQMYEFEHTDISDDPSWFASHDYK